MSKFPRKKKLVNFGLQLKLIGTFMAVSCFAALAQVILLSNSMMDVSQDMGPASEAFVKRLPPVLTSDIISTFAFLLPFMFLIGLHITHRVAGPLYRIDCYLDEVARTGELPGVCKVREGDELQALVSALNLAFARLEADRSGAEPTPAERPADLHASPSLVRDGAASLGRDAARGPGANTSDSNQGTA